MQLAVEQKQVITTLHQMTFQANPLSQTNFQYQMK